MRPLTLPLPDAALPTLDPCVPQTQAARGCRRAPWRGQARATVLAHQPGVSARP